MLFLRSFFAVLTVCGTCQLAVGQANPATVERVTAFWPGFTLRAGLGANSYGPERISNKNLTVPLSASFVHEILPATLKQPRFGLRASFALDPTNHRMSEALYLRYTGLKPGFLSTDLGAFLESSPASRLSLYAQASAGLRLYPFLDNGQDSWHWWDNYTQLTAALGVGFSYQLSQSDVAVPVLLRAGANFHYQRYDFDTRTEEIYRQQSLGDTHFNSVQIHAALVVPFCPAAGLELTGNWYGRAANDPRTKFYDVHLGLFFRVPSANTPPTKPSNRHPPVSSGAEVKEPDADPDPKLVKQVADARELLAKLKGELAQLTGKVENSATKQANKKLKQTLKKLNREIKKTEKAIEAAKKAPKA